jgi:hypothetical protein
MFRTRFSSSGEIDVRGETHAIAHRDPGFLHDDVVAAIGAEGNLRGRKEHKQQREQPPELRRRHAARRPMTR